MNNEMKIKKHSPRILIAFTLISLLIAFTMRAMKTEGSFFALLAAVLFFIISSIIYIYRRINRLERHASKKMAIPLLICFFVFVLGKVFVVMHFPGAGILTIISVLGIGIFYFIRFLAKKEKHPVDYVKLGIALFFALQGGNFISGGILLPLFGYNDKIELIVLYSTWSMLFAWFVMEGFTYLSEELDPEINYFSNFLFAFAFLCVIVGAYLRFEQNVYAFHLIILGLIVGLFWTFYDRFFEAEDNQK